MKSRNPKYQELTRIACIMIVPNEVTRPPALMLGAPQLAGFSANF